MKKKKIIMLLITYSCNLNCVYCYEPKKAKRQMTVEQAKSYIMREVDAIEEPYEEFEIDFMGGEPLMNFPLIRAVSEWAWSAKFKVPLNVIFVTTNGTLLNDEMKTWFSENRERIWLGLSFDGDYSMQDMNRSGSARAIDIPFFVRNWPNQTVKMTVTPQTLGHLYEGVVYLHNVGFKEIQADLALGEKVQWEQKHLIVYQQQLTALKDFYLEHPDFPPCTPLQLDMRHFSSTSKKHCGCGEGLICIDVDGEKYACHLFAPITTTPEKARASQKIDFHDDSLFFQEECNECVLYPVCGRCCGMNYLCTGTLFKNSPFSCATAKIRFLLACELRLRQISEDSEEYKSINDLIQKINY